jgi:hypothetical protein
MALRFCKSILLTAVALVIPLSGSDGQIREGVKVACYELRFEVTVSGESPVCTRWGGGEVAIERALHPYTDNAFLHVVRVVPAQIDRSGEDRLRRIPEAAFQVTDGWAEIAEVSDYAVQDFVGWTESPEGLSAEDRDLLSYRCFSFARTEGLVDWSGLYCSFGGGPPLHPVLKAKILARIVKRSPS